jgi:hypothetical protein
VNLLSVGVEERGRGQREKGEEEAEKKKRRVGEGR